MNSTNETFYSLDYWFTFYGYPYIADLIVAYAITPIWFLSLILSIFSLFILRKAPFFASNFFSYMRLYVANCLILSLLGLATILGATHRFFSITNTYEAVFLTNYVLWFIGNCLILFSSSIEICLIVEKMLYLMSARFKRIKVIKFNLFFFVLFVACILVNVPLLFILEPAFADVQLDKSTLFRVWYIGMNTFSSTLTGQIFYYLAYIFRDILPMIFKLILNSLSIYLVRRYVRNKQRIRSSTITTLSSELVSFDRKQTYVALVMNTFSLLEHMLYIASYIFYYINNYDLSTFLIVIAFLFISVKHFCIFFILLFFNSLFRNEVKNCFRYAPIN